MANKIISQRLPTIERVRELLDYDPLTGMFTRRVRASSCAAAGDKAGTLRQNGYVGIAIDGTLLYAHRIAWMYMTGAWPLVEIDHKNTVRHDNRFVNLRAATASFNRQNIRKATKRSSTGVLGVFTSGRGFRPVVRANGKNHYFGTFDTEDEAYKVYVSEKRKLHAGCTL